VSIRTAYELLHEGKTEPVSLPHSKLYTDAEVTDRPMKLQANLRALTQHLRNRLKDYLHAADGSVLQVDHVPNSPIFSLRTPFPRQLASACQQQGFVVRAIMPPTVPAGKERVRVCLHAGNTTAEIDDLVRTIERWVREVKAKREAVPARL